MKWVSKIPYYEFQFEFARSGGPGGQHVNRTNSAAILRWNLVESSSFSDLQKALLLDKLYKKLNQSGELIIRSEEFRDQDRNKKRCLEKLDDLLTQAFYVPKKRKPTKPTRASREKRLTQKKRHSEVKKSRSKKDW